jgi:hypothetical protein
MPISADLCHRLDCERVHEASGLRAGARDAQPVADGGTQNALCQVGTAGISRAQDEDKRVHAQHADSPAPQQPSVKQTSFARQSVCFNPS